MSEEKDKKKLVKSIRFYDQDQSFTASYNPIEVFKKSTDLKEDDKK